MGWQDRGYNRGGGSTSDYFGNPASLLGFSVPFGTWFGVRVRLHFWLLLSFLFIYINGIRGTDLISPTIECALTIAALLGHEFGHRVFARRMGGSHDEFMLWPAGGMIPPNAPPFPWAFFVTHVGGIVANVLLAGVSIGAILLITADPHAVPWNPLTFFFGLPPIQHLNAAAFLVGCFYSFAAINVGLVGINLLPYYWFDGGPLLQSILWPFVELYQSINVTCIVGMVLAGPMAVLSLFAGPAGIFAVIFWAMLFASSLTKRRQLKAAGPQELEDAIAWSASYSGPSNDGGARRKKLKRHWSNSARKKAKAEQLEQARIDEILAKVKEQGLHSLTWGEKRALKKATERQRRRDVARRG